VDKRDFNDPWLSQDQLKRYTKCNRKSDQIAWLKMWGVPFRIAKDGHPRVLLSDLGVSQKQQVSEPDLEAVKRLSTLT